jgi:L-lactate dehydrogenase (cytochrome)
MYVKAYGEVGVVHMVRILQREIRLVMQSLGVQKISQLVPQMVRIAGCAFLYFC